MTRKIYRHVITILAFLTIFLPAATYAQPQNDHLIVAGSRVGPISLGMSTQELYKAMGEPTESVTGNDGTWASYSWEDLRVWTDLPSGQVSRILVGGPSYSIDHGLTIGASELAMRAYLPNPQSTTAQTPQTKHFCYAPGLGIDARADETSSEKVAAIIVQASGCGSTGNFVCFHSEGGMTHLDRQCRRAD